MTSVLSKARTVEDSEAYFKWVFYGDKGAGKTFLAGGAPDPVFIDLERSTETLMYGGDQFKHVKKLQVGVDIKSVQDLIDTIRDAIRSPQFKTIVIDTVTRLQIWQMRQYMDELVKEEKYKNRDRLLPYKGDFRISLELLDEVFMELQQAPINVIYCAHERKDVKAKIVGQDTTYETTRIYPDLTPALSGRLAGLLNLVGYLTSKPKISSPIKAQERKLQVNPGLIIEAKNRLGIEMLEITDPTFEKIVSERKQTNAA